MRVTRAAALFGCIYSLALVAIGCPGALENPELFLADDGNLDGGVADTGSTDSGPGPCDFVVTEILSSSESCASSGCHSTNTQLGDLDLESPDLFGRLSGELSPNCAGQQLINVEQPAESLLYTKLTPARPCGGPMPPVGTLEDNEIQCVLTWIESNIVATPSDAGFEPDTGVEADTGVIADSGEILLVQFFEAEAATIRAPFEVQTDNGASGNQYVVQPVGTINNNNAPPITDSADVGLMTFDFELGQAGTTTFWALARGTGQSNDSFWVRVVDETDWIKFNEIPSGNDFVWTEVNDFDNGAAPLVLVNAAAGSYTLEVIYREPGAQLDQILISQDPQFDPSSN